MICTVVSQSNAQNFIIAVESNDKSENERKLDKDLQNHFDKVLKDALGILESMEVKNYEYIRKRLQTTSLQNHWSLDFTKENVNWASDKIFAFGIPPVDSILLRTSHPISWIKQGTDATLYHRITFNFTFSNDGEEYHNRIRVSYTKTDNPRNQRLKGYELSDIDFRKSELTEEFMTKVENIFDVTVPEQTLYSAIRSAPSSVKRLVLKPEDFELFENEYSNSFPNLIELKIRATDITRLPNFIKNMTYLKTLDVSYNRLTKLPEWICTMTNLETLNASYNEMTSVPDCIENLQQVEVLKLQGNDLLPEDENKVKKWFKNIDL